MMTDDELDRALFALPLEEPPADLRARILGATVAHPRLTIGAWETWCVGTIAAFTVWLAFGAMSGPNVGGRIVDTLEVALGVVSANTLLWVALGMSCAVWASQLSLPASRSRVADR